MATWLKAAESVAYVWRRWIPVPSLNAAVTRAMISPTRCWARPSGCGAAHTATVPTRATSTRTGDSTDATGPADHEPQ